MQEIFVIYASCIVVQVSCVSVSQLIIGFNLVYKGYMSIVLAVGPLVLEQCQAALCCV